MEAQARSDGSVAHSKAKIPVAAVKKVRVQIDPYAIAMFWIS